MPLLCDDFLIVGLYFAFNYFNDNRSSCTAFAIDIGKTKPRASTCIRVLILLALCPGLQGLPVVIAAPLIQPRVRAGAAVAQLAFPAADDRVLPVDLLRTLESLFPRALGVLPAVAKLPAGFHVENNHE